MATGKPAKKPAARAAVKHDAPAAGGDSGLTITPNRIILWGGVVGAIVTISAATYAVGHALDTRYLLRVVGEKYQISNCQRFEQGRQATVDDAIARLEIQRDQAKVDRKVAFTAADEQTLARWYRQRKTEREIKDSCIEETKQP